MRTTDGMSITGYAELVRRVVAWLQACKGDGRVCSYKDISRRYKLTFDEVADLVCDSDVYGPKVVVKDRTHVRGNTTVEVLS